MLFEVPPNFIAQWKPELPENAEAIFEWKGKEKDDLAEDEVKSDDFYNQIGWLKVENDFLNKSTGNGMGASRPYRRQPSRVDHQSARITGNLSG